MCPRRRQIQSVLTRANKVVILDHHDSAIRDTPDLSAENLQLVIDAGRCGCQIAWDYFHPEKQRPWFVEFVADRDLWNWRHPDSKALATYHHQTGYYYDWNRIVNYDLERFLE